MIVLRTSYIFLDGRRTVEIHFHFQLSTTTSTPNFLPPLPLPTFYHHFHSQLSTTTSTSNFLPPLPLPIPLPTFYHNFHFQFHSQLSTTTSTSNFLQTLPLPNFHFQLFTTRTSYIPNTLSKSLKKGEIENFYYSM